MSSKLRVGILGSGWAGQSHAVAFSKLDNVSVTALWSRTRSRAENMVSQQRLTQVQIYDDWQDLIETSGVDIICIACAQWLRRDAAVAALNKGMHVLIEKPLSIEIEDAHATVEAAKKAGTVTAICFTTRYMPGLQVAKDAIQSGNIGRILNYETRWHIGMTPRAFHERWPWGTDETALLGGAGSHEFDRIRFLTGADFASVTGHVLPFSLPEEPEFIVNATYSLVANMANDSYGWLGCTLTLGEPTWFALLNGEHGTLRVANDSVVQQVNGEEQAVALEIPGAYQPPEGEELFQFAWNRLIGDFVEAIRSGDTSHASHPNLPSLSDGLQTQQVIAAAVRAQHEQRWVIIDEFSR
jgi:predicted dehydrogenase